MADKEKNAAQEAADKKQETVDKKAKKTASADSAKSGKTKKDGKDKKKNVFSRIAGWFKDLRKEFKKVVWPDRKKVINNTLVVLVVVIIGSVLVGLIDSGLLKLMEFLMGFSN